MDPFFSIQCLRIAASAYIIAGMIHVYGSMRRFLSSVEGRYAVRFRFLFTQFLLRYPWLRIVEGERKKVFCINEYQLKIQKPFFIQNQFRIHELGMSKVEKHIMKRKNMAKWCRMPYRRVYTIDVFFAVMFLRQNPRHPPKTCEACLQAPRSVG